MVSMLGVIERGVAKLMSAAKQQIMGSMRAVTWHFAP